MDGIPPDVDITPLVPLLAGAANGVIMRMAFNCPRFGQNGIKKGENMQTFLHGRDLIGDLDFSKEEVETVLDVAFDLKRKRALGELTPYLRDKVLAMLFFFQQHPHSRIFRSWNGSSWWTRSFHRKPHNSNLPTVTRLKKLVRSLAATSMDFPFVTLIGALAINI